MYLLDFSVLGLGLMFGVTPSAAVATTRGQTTAARIITAADLEYCTPTTTPYDAKNLTTYPLTNTSAKVDRSPPSQLDTTLPEVSAYIVKVHNCLRSLVWPAASNMLEMEWSAEAAVQAQGWADKCLPGHNPNGSADRTTESEGFGCGQNCASSSGNATWYEMVNAWYNDEASRYLYPGTAGPQASGHYTQLVWAESYQVGCGHKTCASGTNTFVCNYCPGGNYGDEIPYMEA